MWLESDVFVWILASVYFSGRLTRGNPGIGHNSVMIDNLLDDAESPDVIGLILMGEDLVYCELSCSLDDLQELHKCKFRVVELH